MEQITLRKMREIIGWSNKDGDGIFSPGGFFSFVFVDLTKASNVQINRSRV